MSGSKCYYPLRTKTQQVKREGSEGYCIVFRREECNNVGVNSQAIFYLLRFRIIVIIIISAVFFATICFWCLPYLYRKFEGQMQQTTKVRRKCFIVTHPHFVD